MFDRTQKNKVTINAKLCRDRILFTVRDLHKSQSSLKVCLICKLANEPTLKFATLIMHLSGSHYFHLHMEAFKFREQKNM